MIIGTSALEQLVSRAVVGRKTVDEVSQDASARSLPLA
ncbi:hypothetical protein ALP85_01184 [Pseudomonas syringae pv. syringae]|nr:hypothetical protein ALP85_01184 [Pseudomonas syringae pv. syringae]